METDKSRVEFFTALAKAQGEIGPALKSSTNPFFQSKYADLNACLEAVREPLSQNGIVLLQPADITDDGYVCINTILAKGDYSIDAPTRLPIGKKDPQEIGKLITYARRYALCSMLGIPQEDDDAEGSMGRGGFSQRKQEEAERWGDQRAGEMKTAMAPKKSDTLAKFKKHIDDLANEGPAALQAYWEREDVQAFITSKSEKLADEAQAYVNEKIELLLDNVKLEAAE